MHRTRAGLIPYQFLQFGRLRDPLLLDGREEFSVHIPSAFRDSLEMMYGVRGAKKRVFHLNFEFYDPAEPGTAAQSPQLRRCVRYHGLRRNDWS